MDRLREAGALLWTQARRKYADVPIAPAAQPATTSTAQSKRDDDLTNLISDVNAYSQ